MGGIGFGLGVIGFGVIGLGVTGKGLIGVIGLGIGMIGGIAAAAFLVTKLCVEHLFSPKVCQSVLHDDVNATKYIMSYMVQLGHQVAGRWPQIAKFSTKRYA